MLELNEKQLLLLEFVKTHHEGQVRKYTGLPYYTHPLTVAKTCKEYISNLTYEIEVALCHDLIEDTSCTYKELASFLTKIKYGVDEVNSIYFAVEELTDIYTSESYPKLTRKERKHLELQRLKNISILAQNVKCSDLIDNVECIAERDLEFAKVYTPEKKAIVDSFTLCDQNILRKCQEICKIAEEKLVSTK